MRTTVDPKSERLNVRLTADERARIERIARTRGLSVSQLVLELVSREDAAMSTGRSAPRPRM